MKKLFLLGLVTFMTMGLSAASITKGKVIFGVENIKNLPVQILAEEPDCYFEGVTSYDISTSRFNTKLVKKICKNKEDLDVKGWLVDLSDEISGTKSLSCDTEVKILIGEEGVSGK